MLLLAAKFDDPGAAPPPSGWETWSLDPQLDCFNLTTVDLGSGGDSEATV